MKLLLTVSATVLLLVICNGAVGPVRPDLHPSTRLKEAIRKMRLSLDRELLYLARAESDPSTVRQVTEAADFEPTDRQEGEPSPDQDDGFTEEVNTGEETFEPIRPGASVPPANEFVDETPTPTFVAEASASPQPSSSPAIAVAPSQVPSALPSQVPSQVPESSPSTSELPSESAIPIPFPNPVGQSPDAAGGPPDASPTSNGEPFATPVVQTLDPTETPTPVVETPTPVVETPTPVTETPTPVVETPTPVVETPTAVVVTPTPIVETPTPVVETPTPVVDTPTPVVETPTPILTTPLPTEEPPSPSEEAITLPPAVVAPGPSDEPSDLIVPVESMEESPEESPEDSPEDSPEPDETPTPTPANNNTGDDDEDDDDVCFPSTGTVELEDGSIKKMSDVELGDRVRVGPNAFSEVFMFTHKLANVRHAFTSIHTESGHNLKLTKGHYLYVNGALAAAGTVRQGDFVTLADETVSAVVAVEEVSAVGLYNPQTAHGDIIVDGVRATTYTTTVDISAAHSLLAPLRAVYTTFGWTLSAFNSGAGQLASLVPSGSRVL